MKVFFNDSWLIDVEARTHKNRQFASALKSTDANIRIENNKYGSQQ